MFLYLNHRTLIFQRKNISGYSIFVGLNQFMGFTHQYAIGQAIVHPDYKGDSRKDIALIVLSAPVQLSFGSMPLLLPTNESSQPVNSKSCITGGWGALKEGLL